MTVTAPTQENNSYRTPGTFLPVMLERMIESRWKMLREKRCSDRCCATVVTRSLNRWLWLALVFNAQVFAALQGGIISQNLWPPRSPDFDISGFLSLGLPEEESLQGGGGLSTIEALKDNIRLNITHTEKGVVPRTVDNIGFGNV